jgi:hypothetical protein
VVQAPWASAALAGDKLRLSVERRVNAISMTIRIWICLFIDVPQTLA